MKSKFNCNVCFMRLECKYFVSVFFSVKFVFLVVERFNNGLMLVFFLGIIIMFVGVGVVVE